MRKALGVMVTGVAMALVFFIGCSNKPSEEQMQQLNALRAEVSSLEKEIAARESEKAALLRSIADKEQQITQCNEDLQALKSRIQ
ncbi:MAG: hypothetical protein N3A63_07345 [Bacteroidetes bacterium]|nr:hypothetical protein [Bacteroidota bacterium]